MPQILQLTGVSWDLEPLNHLLPLLVVEEWGARFRQFRQFGDSKQSDDAVAAQSPRQGYECGFGGHVASPSSCHLVGGKKTQ